MSAWTASAPMQQASCRPNSGTRRAQLDKIKPVFMLAEGDDADLHDKAFDASYDWSLNAIMKKIGKGEAGAAELRAYVTKPPRPTRATPTVCSSPATTISTRGKARTSNCMARRGARWRC
jgi:hypothetical protein